MTKRLYIINNYMLDADFEVIIPRNNFENDA